MGRRTALLIVAALIAALGTSLVFFYVRGVDGRAEASQEPVQVLKATGRIEVGETMAQAQTEGKLALGTVPRKQVLAGAVNTVAGMEDQVSLAPILPNEQIVTAKFGASGDQQTLAIPKGNIAISVNLSDTGRVAGFVSPGADVAIFAATTAGTGSKTSGDTARLLLPKVSVIAVGATTTTARVTTDAEGAQTTEQLPKTLFTLSVSQAQAERVMYASSHGELTFGLLNDTSKVRPGPGVNADNLFR